MDPNKLLEALRDYAQEVTERAEKDNDPKPDAYDSYAAVELAKGFKDLDEWLTKGGFLPKVWEKGRKGHLS